MVLDIRLPIGAMFTLIGLMLVGSGIVNDPQSYQCALGININLIWGVVLLVFGLLMLVAALRARKRNQASQPELEHPAAHRRG